MIGRVTVVETELKLSMLCVTIIRAGWRVKNHGEMSGPGLPRREPAQVPRKTKSTPSPVSIDAAFASLTFASTSFCVSPASSISLILTTYHHNHQRSTDDEPDHPQSGTCFLTTEAFAFSSPSPPLLCCLSSLAS